MSTLVRAELELAKAELGATAKRGGIAAALFGAAAVVLLLSLPFGFVALAEGLVSAGLWRWLAYLIVMAAFWLVAATLALIGWRAVRRLRKPERTLDTVRDTARWARHPTSRADAGH
jgi:membrane protein implicated in regulation of membrane protease activity